jgi:hypothetical protein
MLPEVRTLSRMEKLQLIRLLAQDLAQEEMGHIEPGQSYPIWSPDRAFSAATAMLQELENEGTQ